MVGWGSLSCLYNYNKDCSTDVKQHMLSNVLYYTLFHDPCANKRKSPLNITIFQYKINSNNFNFQTCSHKEKHVLNLAC